ncbi:MAG: agmatinase, partial [Hyphomicrobiales bacterium]
MSDLFSTGPVRARKVCGVLDRQPSSRRHHPDFDKLQMRGWKAAEKEATLPSAAWEKEKQWALRMGLTGSDCLEDKSIPTFARGELPHYAGINTFLK